MVSTAKKAALQPHSWQLPFTANTYCLTTEQLAAYAPTIAQQDTVVSCQLQFKSYSNGTLLLRNTIDGHTHLFTLQVAEDALHVSCSCGAVTRELCQHAYHALFTITWYNKEDYFRQLIKDGALQLAMQHKQLFDRKESSAGIKVSTRAELATVYQLNNNKYLNYLPAIFHFKPTPQPPVFTSGPVVTYLLMFSWNGKRLPFLCPCFGSLDKNKTAIIKYHDFLSAVQPAATDYCTAAQHLVNKQALNLIKLTEATTATSILEATCDPAEQEVFITMHEAWQQLWPPLVQQPFMYHYRYLGPRELTLLKRPAKKRTSRITLSAFVPQLMFILNNKGAYYFLQLAVLVNGQPLQNYEAPACFFIQHQQTVYLLASARDAAITGWMQKMGGKITVFKEHFAAFEQEILRPLREHYPVITPAPIKRKV